MRYFNPNLLIHNTPLLPVSTLGDPMDCSTLVFPVFRLLPEFAQTCVHWVSDAIQPPHLLSSPSPPVFSFPASGYFPMSWLSHKVAKVLEFPSNEYSGLISFWIDLFDFLVVQGTLKSFLQHQSLKASIIWSSALFLVQFSYPYMTTGKTIALIIWTFVGKVICYLTCILVCNMFLNKLSRFVIAFLPRSWHLLISWLQ